MAAPRLRTKLAASTPPNDEEENKVKGKKAKAEGEEDENEASEDEDEDKDASEGDEEEEKTGKKGSKSAAATERARMKAITTSPSAQHLPNLANALAYDTSLSAKAAQTVLAAAMKDVEVDASASGKFGATGPKAEAFRRAMAAEAPNPSLGTATGSGAEKPRLMSFHEVRAAKADAKRK